MPTSLVVQEKKRRIRILTKCLKYSDLVELQASWKNFGFVDTDFVGLMRKDLQLFRAVLQD